MSERPASVAACNDPAPIAFKPAFCTRPKGHDGPHKTPNVEWWLGR